MRRRTFLTAATAAAGSLALHRVLASTPDAAGVTATDIPAVTGSGRKIVLSRAEVNELGTALRGPLLAGSSAGYEDARRIWNRSFDRRPALIARCLGTADVAASVQFAKSHDLLVAVRCGGHSASGKSVCDDGLMIDLSMMRSVRIDPVARTAQVAGGCLLGDLDREAQAFGLATTAGTVSHTGVGGLTLGGGIGNLVRKYGMTIDNLLSADVITADGKFRRASAQDNPDLFWAIRGGGGNFGVVTSFEFRLHELGRTVYRGELVFPAVMARQVLEHLSESNERGSDDDNVTPTLVGTPDGQKILVVECLNLRSAEGLQKVMDPFRKVARPVADTAAPISYLELQTRTDDAFGGTDHFYLKAAFTPRLDGALIDALLSGQENARLPGMQILTLPQLGGAANRVEARATAFPQRDAQYAMMLISAWNGAALTDDAMRWVRETWQAIEPSTRGVYSNFLSPDDPLARIRASYGVNYERLLDLKRRFDPTNLFRLNANIDPA